MYVAHITEEGDCFINEISIVKEYQQKGIGRQILEEQLRENHQKGIRTVLQVFKENSAKEFYEKLGFKVYGEVRKVLIFFTHNLTLKKSFLKFC